MKYCRNYLNWLQFLNSNSFRGIYMMRKHGSWNYHFGNYLLGQNALMPCSSISPKSFWIVQIVFVVPKSLWLGPNHFGQVQIRLFWTNFYNLDLSKMIWIRPKRIEPTQNDWCSTKMIWTIQNHFGLIEGQGIRI